MFAWSGNRVKPKVKATYTRKKLLNPPHTTHQTHPTHKIKSMAPPTETITMLGEVDNGSDGNDGSIGVDSMDLALPSKTRSKTQLDSSTAAGDEPSQPDDSLVVASAANAQVLHETAATNKEPSQDEKMDDSREVFNVDCFMADDFRKV